MTQQSSTPLVHACVLAAGLASRFGQSKLVKTVRGKPLVQHALLAARESCHGRVTLVVGHNADAVTSAGAGLFDHLVNNEHYGDGIGSSIAAGVHACRANADAVLILLADQPLISAAHLQSIITSWSGADNAIVVSSFDGIVSPPILFPINTFDALCALSGDMGAKAILSDTAFDVTRIECPQARFDIDTPADLDYIERDD